MRPSRRSRLPTWSYIDNVIWLPELIVRRTGDVVSAILRNGIIKYVWMTPYPGRPLSPEELSYLHVADIIEKRYIHDILYYLRTAKRSAEVVFELDLDVIVRKRLARIIDSTSDFVLTQISNLGGKNG